MDWIQMISLAVPSIAMIMICIVVIVALVMRKAAIDIHFNGMSVDISDANGQVIPKEPMH